jgi:release factor glutamine methyltransferase|tara:strand:- start:5118 stop:5921 length:804 start_codon:yes stop_codon:yes gene_type:complete
VKIGEILKTAELKTLEAELLLGFVMRKSREWVIANPDFDAPDSIKDLIKRRASGEPLAYIVGKKEFYGREFTVNPSVLIPRPSTEGLIDLTLEFIKNPEDEVRKVDRGVVCFSKKLGDSSGVQDLRQGSGQAIVDVGTGSGCIAITLALENPDLKIIAIDISEDALEVAKKNSESHNAQVEFRKGNLMEPLNDLSEPFILVSNPPYIPDSEELMKDVKDYEPSNALFGGEDGMDVLNELMRQAKANPLCTGVIIECREEHANLFVTD